MKLIGGNIGLNFVRCEQFFKFTIVASKAADSRLKPTIKLQISNCYYHYNQITDYRLTANAVSFPIIISTLSAECINPAKRSISITLNQLPFTIFILASL